MVDKLWMWMLTEMWMLLMETLMETLMGSLMGTLSFFTLYGPTIPPTPIHPTN